MYKHLFFDLDHTLWDFDANARITMEVVFDECQLTQRGVDAFEPFFRHYLHHNEILWNRYHNGFITADELKWKRMWRTLLEFKIGDEVLAKTLSSRFLEILPVQKTLFPYTIEVLEYLQNKGYQMHLITNGFEKTQWSKVNNSGLDRFFTHMITSESSNSLKPHKEIFDYALQQTGARVQESIMLGDNQEADIQGAINAGMDSVFINHIGAEVTVPPTHMVHHLKELEQLL